MVFTLVVPTMESQDMMVEGEDFCARLSALVVLVVVVFILGCFERVCSNGTRGVCVWGGGGGGGRATV